MNLLIYLNKDWKPDHGGELELWDRGMNQCVVRVPPKFNTAVIFNTDLDSYHGHPDPMNFPEGDGWKSIALYDYTSTSDLLIDVPMRTTVFKARPGTLDQVDYAIMWMRFLGDWFLPIALRVVRKLW